MVPRRAPRPAVQGVERDREQMRVSGAATASDGPELRPVPIEFSTSARPTLPEAEALFLDSLAGRSPLTASTYRNALGRFHELLVSIGTEPEQVRTDTLSADLLERFYLWLTRVYGRENRFTVAT